MRFFATLFLAASMLSSCGKPAPKPADADIAAYLAQSTPSYLRVSGVHASFDAPPTGTSGAKEGAWRVTTDFTLHAQEDLFSPVDYARGQRTAFDRAVRAFEMYRPERITAAEQLAQRVGLMKSGDAAPEPAVPAHLVTHAGQDLADRVTLLARPDGTGWKFFQLDAQTLSDDAIGAPIAILRRSSPRTVFVMAGSDEDHAYQNRAQQFLATLGKAPGP